MAFWDPFEEMRSLHEDMDKLFGNLYGGALGTGSNLLPVRTSEKNESARLPVCDVRETDSGVMATFEIPGVSKDDIELNLDEDSIEVSAKQKAEKEEKGKDFHAYRSVSRQFYRKIPLPVAVKTDNANAEYRDGVLTVTAEKKEQGEKRKRLEIK